MKRNLRDSEERITELEELYVKTRNKFLEDFDNMDSDARAKELRQLRGMLDDTDIIRVKGQLLPGTDSRDTGKVTRSEASNRSHADRGRAGE